jgi:hypothetical protein
MEEYMAISLVRAIYEGREGLLSAEEEYEQAWKDIELFYISPQIYHALQQTGRLNELPDFFRQRLKFKADQAVYQNLYMRSKEDGILKALDSRGLPVIPLKGVRFAERYFGHFSARLTSDIDIFVPEDRLQEAIEVCCELGFEFEIVKDHHARLHKGSLMVELHWTLDKLQWSELHTAPFWTQARSIQGFDHVRELSPLHTLYFICLHGARHQMDSIRYVLDVARILYMHGFDIDYEVLFAQTSEDKTTKRVQAVLSIVYQEFPQLHELKPLPFQPLNTHWSYSVVRDARLGVKSKQYFMYKFFFRHLMFDTLKHQFRSIRKAY